MVGGSPLVLVVEDDREIRDVVAQILELAGYRVDTAADGVAGLARIERGDVDLVVNTPTGSGARSDGWEIRRAAVARGIPCLTTLSGGLAAARAIAAARAGDPPVTSLQELHSRRARAGATT